MPGGYGGSDIYVVDIHPDGSLGTPENLGDVVNTKDTEGPAIRSMAHSTPDRERPFMSRRTERHREPQQRRRQPGAR